MSKITNKKTLIILVACLMLALVAFSACSETVQFKPTVELISGKTVGDNGGIAVEYGDYIYYVNGYQANVDADGAYSNDIRTGAIVRIEKSKIDEIVAIHEEDIGSTEKTERIATLVEENVKLIVPCFYYSANTTDTSLTGIYIFNDRIYITTPNQELTTSGNTQHTQLALQSYALDGSDQKTHFVFEVNSTKIMLSQVDKEVYATYLLDSDTTLHSVKVSTGSDTVVVEKTTSVTFDGANNRVVYLDEDGQICQYTVGESAGKVLVKEVENKTYTIAQVSNGYVYYTVANSKDATLDGLTIYYAELNGKEQKDQVVINAKPTSAYVGWGAKIIATESEAMGESSIQQYRVFVASGDATDKQVLFTSAYAVTLGKIEGNLLHYTSNGISYTFNLDTKGEGVPYAKSLSTTAQGWALPDVVGKYVFSLDANGKVNVVVFDGKENTTSTSITLVAEEVAE